MASDCFICNKHQHHENFAGQPLLREEGFILAHFPIIDGEPATRGHLLLEPRRHILDMSELNATEAAALGSLLVRATALIKSQLGAEHVYLFRINDKVPHLHFHLVPRYPGTPQEFWGLKIMEWAGVPKLKLNEIQTLSRELATAAGLIYTANATFLL